MNFGGIEIYCPMCREELAESEQELACSGCRRRFPIASGIPDLRVFADPYIGMEADRKKAADLDARAAQETFSGLLDYYYGITAVVPPNHARNYKRSLLGGPARAAAALASWERVSGTSADGRLLEIGCGTGPMLLAAAQRGYRVAGVDIALRWLVAARKRLAEAGVRVPLICACAEALPFREEGFDGVAIDSAIEMMTDQARALREAHRVLAPGGRLFLATPNRFSLGPDPHLGVPGGGWLPRPLLEALARRQGALTPKRNLLWAGSLSRLIRAAGFDGARLEAPAIADAQLSGLSGAMRAAAGVYQAARRTPVAGPCLRLVGPLLHATAHKPRGAGREV